LKVKWISPQFNIEKLKYNPGRLAILQNRCFPGVGRCESEGEIHNVKQKQY